MADSVRGESVDKSEPQSDEPSELKADASEKIPTDQPNTLLSNGEAARALNTSDQSDLISVSLALVCLVGVDLRLA